MLSWIVRIFFILAALIAALLVSRDALNFGLRQTMVAMILMVGFVALAGCLDLARAADTFLSVRDLFRCRSRSERSKCERI
jgi:hypothetical protein